MAYNVRNPITANIQSYSIDYKKQTDHNNKLFKIVCLFLMDKYKPNQWRHRFCVRQSNDIVRDSCETFQRTEQK